MELRRLQLTGGTSYVVSLPKKWVVEQGLKKNDNVGIIVQEDGNLVVTPNVKGRRKDREKVFTIGEEEPLDTLLRKLIGAYIMGYDIIKVESERRLSPELREIVRNFTRMVIGPEIVEETMNSVTTKDLLNPSDLSFKQSIQRMLYMVKSMHHNVMVALKENDTSLAEDIISRDSDLDKLAWLIARQFNIVTEDHSLLELMDTTAKGSVEYLELSRILERMGDHAVKIASNVPDIEVSDGVKKLIKELETIDDEAINVLDQSLQIAFEAPDPENIDKLNDQIRKVQKYEERCQKIHAKAIKIDNSVTAAALSNVTESVARSSTLTRDICEVLINYLVNLEQK